MSKANRINGDFAILWSGRWESNPRPKLGKLRLKLKNAGNGGNFSDFGLPQMETENQCEGRNKGLKREIAAKFYAARGPEPPKIREEERVRRVNTRANLLIKVALRKLTTKFCFGGEISWHGPGRQGRGWSIKLRIGEPVVLERLL